MYDLRSTVLFTKYVRNRGVLLSLLILGNNKVQMFIPLTLISPFHRTSFSVSTTYRLSWVSGSRIDTTAYRRFRL